MNNIEKVALGTVLATTIVGGAALVSGNKVDAATQSTYKTTSNLNIRSGPSTLYSKVGLIPKGGTVTVLDYKDGWCKIKYGRVTGYCSSMYLAKNNTNSAVVNNNQMLKTLDRLVIINQSNMTLSYYSNGILIKTFYCATGKSSTPTPNNIYKVINKERNRPYYSKGIPGGSPRNPLGTRFIQLTSSGYAIHGTNNPGSIGSKVSNGCVRLNNRNVEWLYDKVRVGTTVIITGKASNKDVARAYGIRVY